MDKKQLVRKSNNLVNAKYELSKIEQKLILSLITQINQSDEDFRTYRFNIKEYFDITDFSKENYTYIKSVFKDLLEKPIEIKIENGTLLCNWISSAKIINKGYVDISFDPNLKPYLLELKANFTRYELKNVLFLRSQYSIRIYELLKQYEKLGKRLIDMEDFRTILKIPTSYSNFKIKKYILDVAKRELKEHSDIYFDYEIIKKARSVTWIQFKIYFKLPEKQEPSKDKFLVDNRNDARIPPKFTPEEESVDSGKTAKEAAEECLKSYKTGKSKCFFQYQGLSVPFCRECEIYKNNPIIRAEEEN